ncbi:MAG: sodium:alanine symporter family protein [Gammaproteobacteria bacterium]|nr:sodium:alanine symporter family protein [Gammaproteobacteria bacterium]MBQ0839040.1 sodium:alanine symporter family protein [Gammaproteobacteria bacterium]
MKSIETLLSTLNSFAWGPAMLFFILCTGLYLMLGLRLLPLRKLGFAFVQLFKGGKARGEGDISPFAALMTSLSATVGTGNIAGVATAIGIGGPGALFWMWCTALLGMATKYAEAVLAVHYRETDDSGRKVGGPMYYIKNGLGQRWLWLATLFALFGMLAGFGIGNTVQASEVARVMESSFQIPHQLSGAIMALLVGIVLLGGVKVIARVATTLVPLMGIAYILGCVFVIAQHFGDIPAALSLILHSAFNPVAAEGGFAGAAVMLAIRMGVARGVFSNEAGLGSAPIAHAAAETDSPVRQGSIAMLGTFIDTLIICTMTGLVIILTGVWTGEAQAAAMTASAFASAFPDVGDKFVAITLVLFAFTTILGWSYYGERCAEYLFGLKIIVPYRILWTVAVYIGATKGLGIAWLLADTLNALMAIPNLIALLLLSPVIFRLTRSWFAAETSSK